LRRCKAKGIRTASPHPSPLLFVISSPLQRLFVCFKALVLSRNTLNCPKWVANSRKWAIKFVSASAPDSRRERSGLEYKLQHEPVWPGSHPNGRSAHLINGRYFPGGSDERYLMIGGRSLE
jgi:hypothetical protein